MTDGVFFFVWQVSYPTVASLLHFGYFDILGLSFCHSDSTLAASIRCAAIRRAPIALVSYEFETADFVRVLAPATKQRKSQYSCIA